VIALLLMLNLLLVLCWLLALGGVAVRRRYRWWAVRREVRQCQAAAYREWRAR
jgi:hypothetical protein